MQRWARTLHRGFHGDTLRRQQARGGRQRRRGEETAGWGWTGEYSPERIRLGKLSIADAGSRRRRSLAGWSVDQIRAGNDDDNDYDDDDDDDADKDDDDDDDDDAHVHQRRVTSRRPPFLPQSLATRPYPSQ